MRKITMAGLALLATATLAACSQNKASDSSEPKASTAVSSSVVKETKATTDYDAIISEIKTTLDPDKTGELTVEAQHDIKDADYPDGHTVIRVLLTGESKKTAQEALDAIYSNSATPEQTNTIAMLQVVISDLAKKLPDDTTTIDLGYEIAADQYDLIAKSSKTKDIIPLIEITVE